MTIEELKAKGYEFVVIHGDGITVGIRHQVNGRHSHVALTRGALTRMEAIETARQRACADFVEHRLN
jgi:carbamate kinase